EEGEGTQPRTPAAGVEGGVQDGETPSQQPGPSGLLGPTVVGVEKVSLDIGGRGAWKPGPKSSKVRDKRKKDARRTMSDPQVRDDPEDTEGDSTALASKISKRSKGSPSPRNTEGEGTARSEDSEAFATDDAASAVDPEGDDGSDGSTKSHTSRSGATKRSRSGGRGKGAKVARPPDSSSGEEEDPPEKKDGRGRPGTTGEGIAVRARKQEKALQGDYDPPKYKAAMQMKKREMEEQIPQLPTRDIVARVLEHASGIDYAVSVSRNLRRDLAAQIRNGALFTKVAVDALSTR
ncbi:PREDICTED: uncharacterized protein LOC105571181, partial [Vollenhovia emeryi]|uniref:uncharacterized protein LOC105571181 n=1 Tax=Vollenhovia emeryi TaxID=411798 RepID=UPI0005F4D0DA